MDEAQAGNKNARRNISNFRYADNTTLMAESKEGIKSFMMKVKEESEKACLKLNIQNEDHDILSHHFIANRWGNNGTVTDFFLLDSKITVDSDCRHKIKRHLLLGKKSYDKPRQHFEKWRHYFTKSMVFPVAMYGHESWTIKKAECQRIDVFKLWCWRRVLRVP